MNLLTISLLVIFLESSSNAELSLILEWQRGKECEHRAKTLKRSPKKAASSEAGSKKELYGIPRREIPKKRGAIGPASRRRMPVLVSGASFACNFVRGSYLEVRVTTSQPVPGGCCSLWPASLFISYIVDELHSVVSVRIARTQRGTREIMPRELSFSSSFCQGPTRNWHSFSPGSETIVLRWLHIERARVKVVVGKLCL